MDDIFNGVYKLDHSKQVLMMLDKNGDGAFEKTELFNHDDRPNFRDRFGPRIIQL